ncbi:MAG: hypothetical protein OCC45_06255 [Desulfotalea sp.]
MHYLNILFLIIAFLLSGCSSEPDQQLILPITFTNAVVDEDEKTISITVREEGENHVDFIIHANLFKRLVDFKSTSASLDDGLTSRALWEDLAYSQTSGVTTFTELQVNRFDIDRREAQITFAAIMIEPKSDRVIQFMPVQYNFTGTNFDKLAQLIKLAVYDID